MVSKNGNRGGGGGVALKYIFTGRKNFGRNRKREGVRSVDASQPKREGVQKKNKR